MADYTPETLTAAAVAIHDADCPDTHCSGAALGHAYRLAEAALAAAAPAIQAQAAAAERTACVAEIFAYANDVLTGPVAAAYRDAARLLLRGGQP